MVKIIQYPSIEVLHGTEYFWRVSILGHYIWSRLNLPDVDIIVPVHFPTDLASMPRILWSVLPPYNSTYSEGAIVHDFLYASHQLTKEESDLVFYETMLTLKTAPTTREILYYGVKIFGGESYKTGPQRLKDRQKYMQQVLFENSELRKKYESL